MGKDNRLIITQVRGGAGKPVKQLLVLRALGLRRTGQSTEKPDNPAVRGMITKVSHLVKVEEKK